MEVKEKMPKFLAFFRIIAVAFLCVFGMHAVASADCSGTSGGTFAVKTTAIGNGQTFQFTIKAKGEFCVDWGDGTYDTYNQSSTSGLAYAHRHTYTGTPTSRVIKIKGDAERYHPADWAWNSCTLDSNGYTGACSKQALHGAIMFGNPPSSKRDYYNMDGTSCNTANTPQFVAHIGDGNGNYTSLGAVFKTRALGGDNKDPGFAYTFAGATNLTGTLPSNLFGSNVTSTKPYMFSHTFDGSGITGIPSDLFTYVKKPALVSGEIAMFQYTFANTGISSIPSGLFKRNKHGIASNLFEGTFRGCTSLTQSGIPMSIFSAFEPDDVSSLFKYTFANTGITSLGNAAHTWFPASASGEFHRMYEGTFAENHNLTSISSGVDLFHVDLSASEGWRADGIFKSTFAGCEHLNSIPSDLFGNYRGGGTDGFNQTFSGCSALQSVPGTLFSKITGSGHGLFYSTFKESGLTSIPPALFSGLTGTGKSNMFYDTFWGCHGLTSVPANLFRITSVGDSTFRGTFAFCDNIGNGISGKLNANNDPIMQPSSLTVNSSKGYFAFASMFEGCSKLTTIAANIIRPIAGAFQDAMFARTFARSGLTSVPSAMFATYHKAPQRWLFKETFAGCSNLRTVANNIFSNMSGALGTGTFDGTFMEDQCDGNGENCQNSCGLRMNMSDLGSNFFGMGNGGHVSGTPKPYMFRNTFKGCEGLTGEIPDYLFFGISGNPIDTYNSGQYTADCLSWEDYVNNVSNYALCFNESMFEGTFQRTGITGTVKALNFYNLYGTPTKSMFKNTFKDCTGLTYVSNSLFNSFNLVQDWSSGSAFEGTFDGCSNLSNDISSLNMFTNLSGSAAPNLFKNTFRGCSSLTGGLSDRFFGTLTGGSEGAFAGTFKGDTGLTSFVPKPVFSGINANATNSVFTDIFNGATNMVTDCYNAGYAPSTSSDRCHSFETQPKWGNGNGDEIVRCCGEKLRSITYNPGASTAINSSTGTSTPAIQYTPENEDFTTLSIGTFENDGYLMSKWNWLEGFGYDEPNHALLPQTRYNYSVPVDTIVEPDWAPCSCDYGNDSGVAECHVHTVNEEVNNVMTNRCGLEVKCKPGWVNPTWSCDGIKCGASCSRGIFDITLDYNGGTPAGGNNYVVGHVSGENTLIGHIFLKYGIGFYETAQDAANDTNNNRYLPNLSGSTEQSFSTSYIPGPVDNKPYQGFYGAYTVQQQQQNNDRGGVGVSDSEIQIINRQGNFTTISTTFTTSDATITARYGDPIYTLTLDDAGGYNGSNQIFLRYQSTSANGPFTPKFYDNYENAFREIDPINRVAIPENPGYRFEGYFLPTDSYTASKLGPAVDTAGIIAPVQFVTSATVPGPKRITDDVTLTAQWSARFLPVCLDHNGATNASAFHDKVWLEYNTDYYNDVSGGYGSVIHYVDINGDNGSVIPQKTGYVFEGYLGPEQGAIRDGGTNSIGNFPLVVNASGRFINKNFTTDEGIKDCDCKDGSPNACPNFIKADFGKEVYEITLDQNGGTGGSPSKMYLWYANDFFSNSAATQQLGEVTVPTRDGYTFGGYEYCNGLNVCTIVIDNRGRVVGSSTFTQADTTITAHWTPNVYEITVNDNCGTNPCQTSGAPTTLYVRYGDAWYRTRANALAGTNSIAAMDTNPARTGYSFEGYTHTRITGRSGGGNGGGGTNSITVTRVADDRGRFLTTEFTTEDTTINADWLGACNLVALNPNQGTAGTVSKLFKRTGSAAWYSDGNCTTQYVTTSDVIPTRQNYVFRGFYAAPAPADVNSDADNTGLTQYIMTNGALSYEGYNLVVSGETVIYAAWARECNSINPGECHLDVLLDGTVTYTVDCPDGFQENGEGTWNPSCTPVCYPITVDNTRRGGTTANSLLYKFGGGSNATKWYSDSTCATEVTTTPAPSKLNATFNGYYWVSGAATRDGGTGNSEFTLVQVGSDDSPSELSDEWTVTGPETIVAYYDCNSHYTENGVDIVGVCANSIYDITLNDNGGSNGNGTVYEKYNAGYALDRDAQSWDLTQLTNIPSYTGYGFRGYYSTQVTPLEANGNTGTLVIKKAGTLPTSPTYFEDDTTVYAGWARDCVSPVAHGSCLRSISDEGAVTYTTSCDSGYVLRSGTGGTYNPICDPGVFTITLDSKYYASANATGVNADTNAAPSPIYVRYADNWYKSTTINSSNLISALTTNPLYSTYVFEGFWTEKTGTGTKIIDRTGAILSGHTTDFTDNGVLYAKWVQTTCSVTNGTGTPLAPVNNVPACSISCTNGYSQNGYLDTTTTFTANGTAGSNTVTASCAARTYQVTLDPKRYESSSATTGVNPDTVGTAAYWYVFNSSSPAYFYSVEVASAADQVWSNRLGSNGYTIVRPTMTGYTFGGYFVGKTGTGNQYMSDGGSAINNLWSNTGTDGRHDITLYAKWTPITYTIAYDLKGGDAPSGNNASDFMPVEYIASTSGGNQYIDTLHTLQSDNVVYKWTARDDSSSSGTSLFGTEGTQSGTRVFSGVLYGSKSTRTLWVGSSQGLSIGYASNDSLYHDWKLHAANNTVSLTKDGTLVNSRVYAGSLYKDKNIVLFGNRMGSTGASQYALAALKHFSIEDNGALVFNGIPVRKISTDQCGLYDTVSGGFFPSGSATPFDCPSSPARPTTATYDLAFGPVVQPTRPHSTFVGWNITNMSTDTTHYKGTTSGNLSTFASGASSATGITDSWFKNLRSVSGAVTFTANWTCDVGYASNAAGTSCDAVNYPMSYTCSDNEPDYTYSDTVPSSQAAHYLQTAPVGTGVHLPAANSCQKIYGAQGMPEYCADCFDLGGWIVEAEEAALAPQAAPLHSVNGTIQTFGKTNGTNWCQVGDLNADWGSGTAGECNGGLSGTSFVLYPHYTPKTYTISYMYATSTGSNQSGNRPDNHTYTETTNIKGGDMSLAHGTFVGWCKDDPTMQSANCTGTETSVGPRDYGPHTYYAKWACDTGYTLGYNNNNEPVCNANTYTITFKTGNSTMATQSCTYGESVTLTAESGMNNDTLTGTHGWSFYGWANNYNKKTKDYNDGVSVTCSGDMTLYGLWQRNVAFTYYNGASATSTTTSNRTQTSYNTTATATGVDGVEVYTLATQSTYNWAPQGWLLNNGTSVVTVTDNKVTPAANVDANYYALYNRTATIAYNANGGTGTTTSTTGTQVFKAGNLNANALNLTLASNNFSKTGYAFTKWAAGSTTGTTYDAGATLAFPNKTWTSVDTYTMYALWSPDTYHITYTMNGGTPAYTQVEYLEGNGEQYIDTGVSPVTDTRVDYKARFSSAQTVSSAPMIGARVGSANTARFFPIAYSGTTSYRTTFGNKESSGTINFSTDYEGSFQPKDGVSFVNGTSYDISSAGFAKTNAYNLYLFATSGYGNNLYYSKGRIYYVRIYDDGINLSHNFVPARRNSDNVLGMYDTVSSTFIAGSGTFTAGADVGPLPSTYTYGIGATVAAGTPTRDHSVFAGWTGSNGNTPQASVTIGTTATGDKAYTANWTCAEGYSPNTGNTACVANTITFNWQNGGHGTAPTTPVNCTYDGTFNMPVAMTAAGYTFQKWITSGTTTTQFDAGATNVACTKANLGVTSGTATVTGSWSVNSYPITIVAGRGISAVSATGWVSDGNGGITKTFNYGDPIDLTTITKTYKNGYIDTAYSATGAGTLSGSNFTVGDGAATITIAAGGIADPTGVNLTISDTEKTYNKSATTLTASQTRTYDSAIHVYYKFGNTSTFTTGNCPTSYAYPSTGITSTTKSISATEYLGKQCHKVKVYASDDSLTSGEVEYTGTKQLHLLKRAVTFNVASGETLVGTATGYAQYNSATLYNGPYGTTTVTAPTATKAGHDFKGWYTLSANGDKVYNATPTLQSGVSNITNNSAQWILDENLALYAQFDLRQITCPATKYLPAGGESASDCTCCLAGYYCPGDTFWYDANNDQGLTVCPAGSFCAACVSAPTACVQGSYTATTGQSACTACQNGTTTSAAGRTSCNANCSNASGAYSWSNASWNNNNTMTNLCTITACNTNYYPTTNNSGNSCTVCTSFAAGLYPYTEGTTLVSAVSSTFGGNGRRACFLYRRQINGSHIAENFALSSTQCAAGTYSYYEPSSTIKTFFGQSYECDICPVDTYSGAGATSCTDCLPGYITNDQGSGSASDCRIYCDGGYYLAHANDTSCDPVGPGHWAPGAWVSQGQTSTYSNCPVGMTTIGYGPGADEVGDCGRKLHVGDDLLYLRSLKKTEPSLNVLVENTQLYGNMSPIPLHMSADIDHMLRLPYEHDIYSVHDDSAETRLSIEQMRGLMGDSDPNSMGSGFVSHDGYDDGQDEIDGTDYGAWYVDFGTEAKAATNTVRVRGTSTCSMVESKAKGGYVTASDQAGVQKDYLANQQRAPKEDPLGTNCYCKVTNAEAPDVQWVLQSNDFKDPKNCGHQCAARCSQETAKDSKFRDVLFRLGAVYASELTAADLEKLIEKEGEGRTYWDLALDKPDVDGKVITPAEHNADWGVAFDYKDKPVQVNGVSACSTLDSGKYQIATDGGLVELQYQMSIKKVPNSKPAGNICYCRVTDPNISGLQWVQALDAKTYDTIGKCADDCTRSCAILVQDSNEVFKSVLFTPQSNSGNGLSETDLKNLIEGKAVGITAKDVLKGEVYNDGKPLTSAENYGDWGVAFDYKEKTVQVNGISVCGYDYGLKPWTTVTDEGGIGKIEQDYQQQMKAAPTNKVGDVCYCKVTDPDLAGLPWALFKTFDSGESCAGDCSTKCAESVADNKESERSVLFTPINGSSSNLTQADLEKLVGAKPSGVTAMNLAKGAQFQDGTTVFTAKNYGDWGTAYEYNNELVQINGISACVGFASYVGFTDTTGKVQYDYDAQISIAPTNKVGGVCWCKLTDPAVKNAYWTEIRDYEEGAACSKSCASACSKFALEMDSGWQEVLFGLKN